MFHIEGGFSPISVILAFPPATYESRNIAGDAMRTSDGWTVRTGGRLPGLTTGGAGRKVGARDKDGVRAVAASSAVLWCRGAQAPHPQRLL